MNLGQINQQKRQNLVLFQSVNRKTLSHSGLFDNHTQTQRKVPHSTNSKISINNLHICLKYKDHYP